MDKETWLKARKLGVSGSDISVLMGANPYKSENSLIMDKLGIQGAGGEFRGNETTRVGNRLEPMVAAFWAKREERIIMNGAFTKDPTNERFIGTPDFLAVDMGLEIKTAGEHIHAKGCPEYQRYQCLWYAMITERSDWHLEACLVPKDRKEVPMGESDEFLYEWVQNRPSRGYDFHREEAIETEMRYRASLFLEKLDEMKAKPYSGMGWLTGEDSGGGIFGV